MCYGEESCDLFVRNRDWPKACADKIGIRLELKTIPIIKYKKIVSRIVEYERLEGEESGVDGEEEDSLADITDELDEGSVQCDGSNCINTADE